MDLFKSTLKLIFAALFASSAMPAAAVTEVTGTTPGGAAYRIAIPDGWQAGGPLVLVQHGLGYELDTNPDLGPLRDVQLASGYAIAASGYRQSGWALFTAIDDNAELVDAFTERFGKPGAFYSVGGSMGGLIALKVAEDPRFRNETAGVLSFCPITSGTQAWDNAFDIRLIYDAVCDGVTGGELPDGAAPYPWAYDLNDIPPNLGDFGDPDLIRAMANVAICTGLAVPEVLRTSGQRTRLASIQQQTGIDNEDFLIASLGYATFGLGDLLRSPDKLASRNPFFNEIDTPHGVELVPYGVPVRRVRQQDIHARLEFDRISDLDGSATARIVGMSTSGDEIAAPWQYDRLRMIYPESAGNRAYRMVWDAPAPSHCGFTQAEALAGWSALVTPAVSSATLPQVCAAQIAAGAAGPCRFEQPPGLIRENTEFRPRGSLATPRVEAVFPFYAPLPSSGVWFDAPRSGEGVVIEELGGIIDGAGDDAIERRRVLVSWYTFAPPGDPDPGPRWLIGVGFRHAQGVYVPSMTLTTGARFGTAFDPADVSRIDWGSLSLTVDPFQQMRLRYSGPPGWEGSERTLQMLAAVDFHVPTRADFLGDPPPPARPPGLESASGTYFTPARDGEGLQLQVIAGATADRKRVVAEFYTYDLTGQQLWLIGVADNVPVTGGVATIELIRASGTVFGDRFDAADVVRTPWGRLTVTIAPDADPAGTGFAGYSATSMSWNPTEPGYDSGGYPLTRITQPYVDREHAP